MQYLDPNRLAQLRAAGYNIPDAPQIPMQQPTALDKALLLTNNGGGANAFNDISNPNLLAQNGPSDAGAPSAGAPPGFVPAPQVAPITPVMNPRAEIPAGIAAEPNAFVGAKASGTVEIPKSKLEKAAESDAKRAASGLEKLEPYTNIGQAKWLGRAVAPELSKELGAEEPKSLDANKKVGDGADRLGIKDKSKEDIATQGPEQASKGSSAGSGSGGGGGVAAAKSNLEQALDDKRAEMGPLGEDTKKKTKELGDLQVEKQQQDSINKDLDQYEAMKHIEEMKEQQDRQNKEAAARLAQLDAIRADFANQKIDPDRMWNSKSTGSKILAGIGVVLGGFGGAATGGVNMAVKSINDSIEKDIDAQKADIGIKSKSFEMANSLYRDMHDMFGNERAATAATRIAMLDYSSRRAAATAAKYETPIMQKRNELLQNQLQSEISSARLSFEMGMAHKPVGGGGGAGDYSGTMAGANSELFVDDGSGTGNGILARSKEEAEKIRANQSSSESLKDEVKTLDQLAKTGTYVDKLNPLSEWRRQWDSAMGRFKQKSTVFRGQGAMSKGDERVAETVLGLSPYLPNDNVIKDSVTELDKSHQEKLNSQNGQRVREINIRNKKGEYERKYVPVAPARQQSSTTHGKPVK